MSKLRKKFTKEERLEIVKQSFDPDRQVSDLADRYGISSTTLS
jgi:transposase-like protein